MSAAAVLEPALQSAKVPVVALRDGAGRRRVLYALQPRQFQAYNLTPLAPRRPADPRPAGGYVKHIGYGGAAGGGKSYLARAVAVAAAFAWPGCTVIIFRRTKDEVKQNHVNKFREEVPEVLSDGRRLYSWNGQELCATFFNGSRIYFGYLRQEDDRYRYQGNEYDVMIFEEATHYAWESVRWLTGNRLRATRPYCKPFVLYPSNPGNIGHAWYKRLFIDRDYDPRLNENPEEYAFVQAFVEDNAELLRRDPTYVRQLDTLPEPYRSWLRKGDWSAGLGLALPMIRREKHIIPPFPVPSSWTLFGAFDWGWAHPFSFGVYAVDEDGRCYKLDTIMGRFLLPHQIAERVIAGLHRIGIPLERLEYIAAGTDIFARPKAEERNTPTIAEQMARYGFTQLRPANTARIAGLNTLRDYLKWEGVGPGGTDDDPYLFFVDTPGNRKCFEQLENLPSDPNNPEDALKTDADAFGNGGDDCYDETRYAMASRPPRPVSTWADRQIGAWDPEVLAHEADQSRRIGPRVGAGAAGPLPPDVGVF